MKSCCSFSVAAVRERKREIAIQFTVGFSGAVMVYYPTRTMIGGYVCCAVSRDGTCTFSLRGLSALCFAVLNSQE